MRGRVVLLLVPLLILPPLTPLWLSVGSSAASVASCSCATCPSGLAATPSTSTSGVATGRVVEYEWLNGSRREKVVKEALTTSEYKKVEIVLRRMGYKPSPEKAIAVRFVREEGEKVEYLVIGIPFEGDPKKPAFTLVALMPSIEALAFQLVDGNKTIRLVAIEPRGKPSRLIPSSIGGEIYSLPARANVIVYQQCQLPSCPPCYAPDCQCAAWDWYKVASCCYQCSQICGKNPLQNPYCWVICVLLWCPVCLIQGCSSWVGVCVDCLSAGCVYTVCCLNCPACRSHPRCLGM